MILGCVLAGGQSSRFGSDKAEAKLDGQSLLALAVARLSGWCDQVVVAGRETALAPTLPDWPRPGMGPLAGLAAALHLASDEGFGAVLSIGVDAPALPDGLPELLSPAPAYLAAQPVIGLWPVSTSAQLDEILKSARRHSMRAFAERIGARTVELTVPPPNINTPADLAALAMRRHTS